MVVADSNLGVEPGAPACPVAPRLLLSDLRECVIRFTLINSVKNLITEVKWFFFIC